MKTIEMELLTIINKYTSCALVENDLFSLGGITPIDTIMIFLETEMEFNLEIPDEELQFTYVYEYINYIKNLMESIKNKHKLN